MLLPAVRCLYNEFKPKGGLYTFDTGASGGMGTMVITTDPKEFVKVLQNEGRHPEGLTNYFAEPFKRWSPDLVPLLPATDLLVTRGETWADSRASLKGLLAPKSARGHLGNINKAAALASRGASACADDFGFFLNRCAFDAFCSVLFGEFTQTADPNMARDPKAMKFMEDAIWINQVVLGEPVSLVWSYYLNKCSMQTSRGRELSQCWFTLLDYTQELLDNFIGKMNRDELDEHQMHSYFMSALESSGGGEKSANDKLIETAQVLLFTSIDTTSAILFSVLVQLALAPDVQDTLANLLREDLGTGGVEESNLKGPAMEYLNAVVRECHRLRPPLGPLVHFKRAVCDLELHGHTVPKESLVSLDVHSIQNDPSFVSDPTVFFPERWLPPAVAARKGSPEAIIDHVLLKTPFSSGARQCPAARVANFEVQCILAHLLKDWNFELADGAGIKKLEDLPNLNLLPGYIHPFPKLNVKPREF